MLQVSCLSVAASQEAFVLQQLYEVVTDGWLEMDKRAQTM